MRNRRLYFPQLSQFWEDWGVTIAIVAVVAIFLAGWWLEEGRLSGLLDFASQIGK